MTERGITRILTAATALIASVVYAPAVSGGWIYDDRPLIAENPYCHSLEWWPRYWVTDFWNVSEEVVRFGTRIAYWRPLISTSYALDWQAGGGSPVMFHVTNLILQAAVGALAFVALRRWIGASGPAFVAALLFVVHPTKAESVAWISGRTDVVCMIAVLLVAQGIARRLRGQPGGLLLEVLGTFVAYSSKEQAIVLPIFAAVEAWVAAERPVLDWAIIRRAIWVALPQLIIAIGYLAIRAVVMPVRAINVEGSIRTSDHVQAVFESFGRFFTLTVAPHNLSIQQGLIHVAGGQPVHSVGYVMLGVVGLIALLTAIVVLRRRAPYVSVGIAFYLGALLPTSNIVYTQMETLISERFLYLPLLGVTLVVGIAMDRLSSKRRVVPIIALAIGIFAAQSINRSADYRDEEAFWMRELELHPSSPIAPRMAIKKAISEKRYRDALAKTLELTRTDVDYQDLPVAFEVAKLVSMLTPDKDRETLLAVDTFLDELLGSKRPEATLKTKFVSFTIPTTTRPYKTYLNFYRVRLLTLRAALQSRLDRDEVAIEIAKSALGHCARCSIAVITGAFTFAAAGLYDDAATILEQARGSIPDSTIQGIADQITKARAARQRGETVAGAEKLHARAEELSALELWGRAFDVLAPYKEEIKRAPKFVRGFAELAFRAGVPEVAREMLAQTMPTAEVDDQLAKWSRVMGWVE